MWAVFRERPIGVVGVTGEYRELEREVPWRQFGILW